MEDSIFSEEIKIQPCTWNECLKGHRWPPAAAIAKCEGCGGPVLAIRMENCPFCNEPNTRVSLRSDYIPRGAGIGQRCKGAKIQGESGDIELVRHQWVEVEANGEPKASFIGEQPPRIPRPHADSSPGSGVEST
jgi:hypothetical protein